MCIRDRTKGYVRERDELKMKAGLKWAAAVNRYYGYRRWVYHPCVNPAELQSELERLAG